MSLNFVDRFGETVNIGDSVIYINSNRRAKGIVVSIVRHARYNSFDVVIQVTSKAGSRDIDTFTRPVSSDYVYKLVP